MNRPPKKKDAKAIFSAAVEYYTPEQWEGYLVDACGDDESLRQRVRELLDAHRQNDGLFDRNVANTDGLVITERPGSQIGPYKLLQEIGEGGFGVVYMAEQLEPVRRKVALKIIKPGMDTKQVIARFEAERQALAMMDHPNIAKVLDAGATESGRPYFVMELVKGIPITEFCDTNKLPARDRLELFVSVCRAIQHAHQKGVIHRDLKPTNVMVTLHDNRPTPVIIDFGVSKAISHQLTEKTLFTAYGQMVGTPAYMSPEQAQMSRMDIDTRSDIFSLGVLLYELLTGGTPLDADQLRGTAYAELQRLIREEEPPKPSTRLSTLGNALAKIAQQRGTDPRRLGQFLRGDLDWIVLKALEKDRNRRYDTANALAHDIERFLNDEAVEARPPSFAYLMRKFVGRNRGLATTAVAVAAAVLLGIIGTTIGMLQAQQEAARAREAMAQQAETSAELIATNVKLTAANDQLQQLISRLRRQSAMMAVDKGNQLIRGEEIFLGMQWWTRGLEIAEAEPTLAGFAKNIRRAIAASQATVPQLVRVITPNHSIDQAMHSQDGRLSAVAGRPWSESGAEHNYQITICDNNTGQLVGQTTLHRDPRSLDFRPDGKALLMCGNGADDKSPFLMTLDIRDREPRRYELPENLIPVKAVFGNDNGTIHLLAGNLERKTIVLARLTISDGQVERAAEQSLRSMAGSPTEETPSYTEHGAAMARDIAYGFSEDRTIAVTATANGVMLWNLTDEEAEGQRLAIDDVAEERVYAIHVSPNAETALIDYGTRLAHYRLADSVLLWEIPYEPRRAGGSVSIRTGKPSPVVSYAARPVVFSPDSRTLLVYDPMSRESRSRLEVRSTETGHLLDAFHDVCRSGSAGIAWLHGENAFVLGTRRQAMVFRFPTCLALANEGRFRSGKINQTVGDIVVNFGRDARALRDIQTGRVRMRLSNSVFSGRRSEGMLVTTAGDTVIQRFSQRPRSPRQSVSGLLTTVEAYDSRTTEKRCEYHPPKAWDTKLSPNGRWIAHSSSRNEDRLSRRDARFVDIYDAENGKPLNTIEAVEPGGHLVKVAFSEDGRRLAVAWRVTGRNVAEDSTVHVDVWDVGEEQAESKRSTIWQHDCRGNTTVTQLQFNGQGDKLLAQLVDEVWVLGVDEADRATRVHNKARQAALLPDGQGVVVLNADGHLQLVDVDTRQVFPLPFGGEVATTRMLLGSDASVLGATMDSDVCPVRCWRMPVAVTESPAEMRSLWEAASHVRLTEHGDIALIGADAAALPSISAARPVGNGAEPSFISRSECYAVKLLDQQQWAAAIPQLEQLIEQDPQDVWARAWRYRCLVELDRLEDAEGEMQQLGKITPRDPDYGTAIAASLDRRLEELDSVKDKARISALRNLAVLTSPAPDEVWLDIAASRVEEGEWRSAIESLQHASQVNPERQGYLDVITPLALMAGDEDLYRHVCADLLERWSDDTNVALRFGAAKANLLRPVSEAIMRQAAALMDSVYEERPDYSWVQSTKGLADYRRDDYPSAIQVLTAVVEKHEDRADASPAFARSVALAELLLAMTYQKSGKSQEAKKLFARASKRIDSEWNRNGGKFVGPFSHDWLIAVIIRQEAETVIPGVAPAGGPVPAAPADASRPSIDM